MCKLVLAPAELGVADESTNLQTRSSPTVRLI